MSFQILTSLNNNFIFFIPIISQLRSPTLLLVLTTFCWVKTTKNLYYIEHRQQVSHTFLILIPAFLFYKSLIQFLRLVFPLILYLSFCSQSFFWALFCRFSRSTRSVFHGFCLIYRMIVERIMFFWIRPKAIRVQATQ